MKTDLRVRITNKPPDAHLNSIAHSSSLLRVKKINIFSEKSQTRETLDSWAPEIAREGRGDAVR